MIGFSVAAPNSLLLNSQKPCKIKKIHESDLYYLQIKTYYITV